MKQLVLILLLSISFASCQEKSTKEHNESTSKILINVEKLEKESVGFQNKYDSLPKLEINQIDENKYLTLNSDKNAMTKLSIKEDKKYYYLGIDNETFCNLP